MRIEHSEAASAPLPVARFAPTPPHPISTVGVADVATPHVPTPRASVVMSGAQRAPSWAVDHDIGSAVRPARGGGMVNITYFTQIQDGRYSRGVSFASYRFPGAAIS